MAKFVYRMQSILDIDNKLEDQARMEFAQAQMRLNEEEEKLEALHIRKAGYEAEAVRIREDELYLRDLMENKDALLRMDEYIFAQEGAVSRAANALERAREKLTEIMKDRKAQEKLRENAFEQFLRDEAAAESKEVDELVSYTYGQKK